MKPQQRRAVALRYEADRDEAPVVVAKGRGRTAEQILKLATEAGVPIQHDPNLVQVLSMLKLDTEIPQQTYAAVAAILQVIYKLNARKSG
jgi:flagellar biosynthesis protein